MLIMNVAIKMMGKGSWRSKNQKLIHMNFDTHSLFWSSFANLPITNGKDEFSLISLRGVAQQVAS